MDKLSCCLICSQTCSSNSTRNFMKAGDLICDEILAQLNIHFVVRKLLQIPERSCEQLISLLDEEWTTWGNSFCLQCSCLIEEAKEVTQQISSLFAKFQIIQQKIQDQVYDNLENGGCVKSKFHNEIKNLCRQRFDFQRGKSFNSKRKKQHQQTSSSEISEDPDNSEDFLCASKSTDFLPINFQSSYKIKNSPSSIADELMDDFLEPDDDYLDPGSVLQVVSDIGGLDNQTEGNLDYEQYNVVMPSEIRNSFSNPTGESSLVEESSKGCDVSKKSEYFRKIMELHSSQAKNTVLITKDKYRRIALDLKHLRNTGKRTKFISNYYKRYELLEFMDTLTLVRSGTQKRVVAAEDLFDVINAAHMATNHGGRDSILKHLKEDFFNVTKHQVNTFLSLCDGCAGKRVRKR